MANLNGLQMLAEQAVKTGREVVDSIVRIDGYKNLYKVTGMKNETFDLEEILPEDSEETPMVFSIDASSANATAVHYKRNPNEKTAPKAEIIVNADGSRSIVINNGTPQSMGDIKVIKVLFCYKNKIFFTVETAAEGFVDLYAYDVQFGGRPVEVMTAISATAEMQRLDDDFIVLINNVIIPVPQVDKNGHPILDANGEQVIKKATGDSTGLFRIIVNDNKASYRQICNGDSSYASYDEYDDVFDDEYDEYDDEINCGTTLPVDSLKVIEDVAGHKDLVVITTTKFDADGYLVPGNPVLSVYQMSGACVYGLCALFETVNADAKVILSAPSWIVRDGNDALIVRTPKSTVYGDLIVKDKAVIAATEGFNTVLAPESTSEDTVKWTFVKATEAGPEVVSFESVRGDFSVSYKLI